VLTPARQRLMPEVPSTTESKALKNLHRRDRHRYFVKRDTPEPVVQALHQALQKAMGDTQLRAACLPWARRSRPADAGRG
jgi:tripartite-type tricarboxylate transporter receptor subunit TctC